MTDKLIILNRCNGYSGEGFFKFEDGYKKMTVAFKEIDKRKYYWFLDGNFGVFGSKTIAKVELDKKDDLQNGGVFYEENGTCYPILYFGDLDIICDGFQKTSGIKTLPVQTDDSKKEEYLNEKESQDESDFEKGESDVSEHENFEKENVENSESKDFLSYGTVEKLSSFSPDNVPDSFWEVNETEINKLLNTLPEDENMASLIPGSKWVKAEEYLLGVIYDEYSVPLYLCYGFDFPWSENPPEKLKGYSQWIPKDCTKPHENGYWVIYVNAKTGERVK